MYNHNQAVRVPLETGRCNGGRSCIQKDAGVIVDWLRVLFKRSLSLLENRVYCDDFIN